MAKRHSIVHQILSVICAFGCVSICGAQKQDIEHRYAMERASGTQQPAPRDPQATYPTPPELPFLTGINNNCDPPFSSVDVNVRNCWQGLQNGIRTIVYAGALADETNQGIVIVQTIRDYPLEPTGHQVPTPVQAGPVQIVVAQNALLTLTSSTASYVLTFDVNTGSFTSVTTMPAKQLPTNQLAITTSGLAYSRSSQSFNGTITVKNISNLPITGPIQIVLTGLTAGAALESPSGMFGGYPVVSIPTVTVLSQGQSATVDIQITTSSNDPVNFTPIAYAGSF